MKPIQLVSGNLYRSSRPESIQALIDADIDIVICLQSGMYEYLTEDRYEVESKKLRYSKIFRIDVPCSDFGPPTIEQVIQVLRIIALHYDKKVLIHCLSGVDRTGFMAAVHRILTGWSFKEAKKEYIAEGQHWWYRWWITELKRYIDMYYADYVPECTKTGDICADSGWYYCPQHLTYLVKFKRGETFLACDDPNALTFRSPPSILAHNTTWKKSLKDG